MTVRMPVVPVPPRRTTSNSRSPWEGRPKLAMRAYSLALEKPNYKSKNPFYKNTIDTIPQEGDIGGATTPFPAGLVLSRLGCPRPTRLLPLERGLVRQVGGQRSGRR